MNITDFLSESLVGDFDINKWIKQGIGLSRNKMPQIDSDQMDYVILHLSNKYKLRKMIVPVSKLLPLQSEINLEKVNKMVKKITKKNKFTQKIPFLVSKDYRLCDGTHTAASILSTNSNMEVVIYRSNLESKKLIEILNKLKVTYKKEINESK